MKAILWWWCAALVLLEAFSATAQPACGPAWLREQPASLTKAPLDDYTGVRVRNLFVSEHFVLSSDRDYNLRLELEAGNHYMLLFYTGADALASGIEIRDPNGLRLDFQKVYGKSENNWLELTFEPSRNGLYNVVMRGIFPGDRSSCAALLVREWDDAEWKEKQKENNLQAGD